MRVFLTRHRLAGPVLLLLASVVVARPASAQQRHAVETIVIDAAVQAGGSFEIRESLTYSFSGRFTFVFRDIPRTAAELVGGIGVQEGGRAYQESDSNEAGTFEISREASSTRVTWYYQADDERRTFDIFYTIDGGVRRFPDTAELYYKFVGDEWAEGNWRSASCRYRLVSCPLGCWPGSSRTGIMDAPTMSTPKRPREKFPAITHPRSLPT